jgi:phosphoglycerate kinase
MAALNIPVGASRVEKEKVKYAGELIERMKARNKKILLPIDHRVVRSLDDIKNVEVTVGNEIGNGLIGIDIGPKTVALYANELAKAKTVFWNGPMGIFETTEYAQGTFAIAKILANMPDATTIVGGGDSAAAMQASGYAGQVTHISTGGGASLEFLQGDKLPGVEALRP